MARRTVDQAYEALVSRLIPTDAQRAAGAGHRATVEGSLRRQLAVSNFFESGSFSHGTGVRGYSDIDAFVTFSGSNKPESSWTALTWVKDALNNTFTQTSISIRRPAVVVAFAGGYETWEVIPAFMTGRGGTGQYVYDIPGAESGTWMDSAPQQHSKYVNDCNKTPNAGSAKSLARLIKAWKYYNNVPISSFYLEMRAAKHVAAQTSYIHDWDVCLLLEWLHSNELPGMNDPTGAASRFHACSSDATRTDALSKVKTAATRARKGLEARQAGKLDDAFYYQNLLFGGNFPAQYY